MLIYIYKFLNSRNIYFFLGYTKKQAFYTCDIMQNHPKNFVVFGFFD